MKDDRTDKEIQLGLVPRRVHVELTSWMISELDKQASLIGVTRRSIIKVWLFELIKTEKRKVMPPYAPSDAQAHRPC